MKTDYIVVHIKVYPESRDQSFEWVATGDTRIAKARVKEAPEKNQANEAVVALLAQEFQIPQRNIKLMKGKTARLKIFHIFPL